MKLLRLFNFLSQSDPTSATDGDLWRNAARFKARIGSVTQLFAFLSDIIIKRTYQFSYMAVAVFNTAPFGKDTTNPSGYPASSYPTTAMANGGLTDATIDPYVVINNCTAKRIRITLGQAAVSQGSVGANPTIRISLWKAGLSGGRTLVGNYDIPLTVKQGTIGVNSTANNVLATGISADQTFALSAGDAIGIQFDPVSTNSNKIYSAGRMVAVLETEE